MKYKFRENFLIRLLFNLFPLILLFPNTFITIYTILFILIGYNSLLQNKLTIKFAYIDYLILIFFILLFFSTINYNNINNYYLLAKSASNLRFAFFFLLVRNLIYFKIIKIENLFIICSICTLLISLDIFLQFFSGKNILGFPPIEGRFSGIFGDEAIAGSYIQKFSMFAVLPFFIFKSKYFFSKKTPLIFIVVFILGAGILMSIDRMPFLLYIFSLSLLLILLKKFRKVISFALFSILLLFLILYKNNNLIEDRYRPFFILFKTIQSELFYKKNKIPIEILSENIENKIIINSGIEYLSIPRSSFYIIKESFWIGIGIKSYLKKCYELRQFKEELLCTTHPHNIYLEIFVSQGLLGIIIFFLFLYLIFKKFFFNFINLKLSKKERLIKLVLLVILIVEIFPLRTHGSIFTTNNGLIFWFILAFISSYKYSRNF